MGLYNQMVTFRNRFKNAYAQIDVQLKRRYDLIPNLVETAKGYLQHERETLEAVIQARNQAVSAAGNAAAATGLLALNELPAKRVILALRRLNGTTIRPQRTTARRMCSGRPA